MQVLGTENLIKYAHKYDLDFNVSIISHELPRVPWEDLVTEHNNGTATVDAIDLLRNIFR